MKEKLLLTNINFLNSGNLKVILPVVIGSIIFLAVIIAVFSVLTVKKGRANANSSLVDSIVTAIISSLQLTNISAVSLHNKRLILTVKEQSLINTNQISSLNLGATLSGNIIKFSLKENANLIYKAIKAQLKGA